VRFAYEWRDDSGHWFRSHGNENWEFDAEGLMRRRIASINDLPIAETDRKFRWRGGRRRDVHPGLSELGLWRLGKTLLGPRRTTEEPMMKREDLTEKILDMKREKGWSWKHICAEIGGMAPTLIAGAPLGQMKLVKPLAHKAAELFALSDAEEAMLNEVPHRGTPMPPTDPLIYRFYELVMVNGPAWKALIEEEFGDGIMSAIDFSLDFEREPNPKGDRVKITMSGKFLPYKYYGAEQGIPEYGFKEAP
jgi:cyanate lyase